MDQLPVTLIFVNIMIRHKLMIVLSVGISLRALHGHQRANSTSRRCGHRRTNQAGGDKVRQ